MMSYKTQKRLLIGACVFLFIGIIAIAYATFTGNLNINGTGINRKSNYDIYFNNVSDFQTTGTASVVDEHPTSKTHTTIIEDYEATLITPGDSIYFTFDIVNDGDYDATLKALTLGPVKCSVNGNESDQSARNVCENIEYTIRYADGSTLQPNNDKLLSKETNSVKVTLTYKDTITADKLPTSDVSISNLGIELVYEADNQAKTNKDGSTPYVPTYSAYSVGDTFILGNDSYHVIAESGINQDYVVALKDTPLTVAEVTAAGGTVNNNQGDGSIGGMAYGSDNTYEASAVKSVVESWATSKFANSELKTVDGYSTRLITYQELDTEKIEFDCCGGCGACIGTDYIVKYDWMYNSNYLYWTMSLNNDTSPNYWYVGRNGKLSEQRYVDSGAVRPVINVYKSAIQN